MSGPIRRVLIISPHTDFAGVGISLKRAFDEFGGTWQARHVRRKPGPYGYPADIEWRSGDRETNRLVDRLFNEADVVHVMDYPPVLRHFTRRHQTIVVQHLGTRFREDPDGVSGMCRAYGALEITDSLDLVRPGVAFVPVAVDTRGLFQERLRLYHPLADVTRIAHAPTDRATSDTTVVEAAVSRLAAEFSIDFDLIEHVSNRECIERKAQADIYIDRFGVGFGVNDIECWAMGVPVVSGFRDPAVTKRAREIFGEVPWLEATPETLYDRVRSLIVNRRKWLEYSRRGLEHADRWHSYRAVVERTTAVYAEAMAERAA